MRSILGTLVCAAVLWFPSFSQAKPCGSDGPIPFLNMTGSVTLPVKSIQSVGAIQEFSFWESQNAIVYRNEADQLRVSYFGAAADIMLGKIEYPLSRIVDPSERYLTTDEESLFFNASTGGDWIEFSKASPAPEKLFWNGPNLYTVRWDTGGLFESAHYDVSRYVAGEKKAKNQCKYYPPSKAKVMLAQGHRYPDIFLYQVTPVLGRNVLSFYRMNALTCDVTNIGQPSELIDGKILDVHRFEALDAFAVRIEHPTKNFRWETSQRCDYMAIGSEVPMIPNHDRPLAVTFTPGKGMAFFNLETMKKAEAFRGIGIQDVRTRDLWIPSHESDLLMSPEVEQLQARRMLSVDVEPILPVASH
jgi:hypothetical protein